MATICKDVHEWIEEQIEKAVEEWIERTEKKCEEYDWWNPIGWFCWLVTILVRVVKFVLVTVGKWVVRVVCEVVAFVLTLFAAIINTLLAIPVVGPFVKAIIRAIVTAISYVIGLLDGLARLFGLKITKHLRVHVIPLCEGVIPLAYETHLTPIIRETQRIFYDRAQIRVHTTVHAPIRNPPTDALRLGTEVDLITDELWLKGTWHQINTVKIFESNLWSLIGLGHPIVVYVIREVGYDGPGKVVGASGGPFVDWVAVERDSVVPEVVGNSSGGPASPLAPYPPTVASSSATTGVRNIKYWDYGGRYVLAHEIGHALGLLGHGNSSPGELMASGIITGDALSPFQVGIIRSSAPVTFF
ncbi:MAG TPA: hypothetical protein VFZ22_06785 [Pyrinomonadaceae bacterium]|nr:hypothetical protein [Pyrinomonadaceae bacterium]